MPLEVKMVKIRIDGKEYEAKAGKNLLESCLSLGIDIPHFCFHPALGSVGACRLCAVKKFRDKDDTKGRIVMSCMEPVIDGLIVSVEDPEAKAFRAAVIEGLMTNHPHDCPVCDEGGECHLQDMTIMAGHNYRRFDFPKRTYNNQYLGPFISHEMNRCIQCYRCVRFYRDYAGGKDLNAFASRNNVYFGRHEEGPLESEFSGNLVEVCPTGVFTDKTLKAHFTRKWDLSNSPSVCVHCSVGCNTIASERYGSLRRIMSRYNGAVNRYFLCDRGRFGYEFVNSEKRNMEVLFRSKKADDLKPIQNDQLTSFLGESFSKDKFIIGIGSPRASLESNFVLMSFVGKDNFFHGISTKEYHLTKIISEFIQRGSVPIPSLRQIENADAIFILGEDVTNTAPMIALALRQAIRNVPNEEARQKGIPLWNDAPVRDLAQDTRSPLFIASSFNDPLDDIALETVRIPYSDIASLGFRVASILDNNAPDPKNEKKPQQELAGKIAFALKNAKNPLIISGVSCCDEAIVHAALNVVTSLQSAGANAMLCMILPECNSMGLSLLPGNSMEDVFKLPETKEIDTLVVLENDLFRRAGEESVNELFKRSKQVIVIDQLINRTTKQADLLMPSSTFAESEGTLVNNEGRAQRFYKSIEIKYQVKESWKWIVDLIQLRAGAQVRWNHPDDIIESLADESPLFLKLKNYMPDSDFRMLNAKIPRQTLRYSGRTAINAGISVSEPKLQQDPDSPLTFSMEGIQENPPSSLVPFYWTPGWNSVQAMYNYVEEPGASLKGGDPGIILISPVHESDKKYFKPGKKDTEVKPDEFMIAPVYTIFGSDELSSESPSVIQKTNEPFILMEQKDAENNLLKDGDYVQLEILKIRLKLKVRIGKNLVAGLCGVSVNLTGMPYIDFPCTGKFHKL
jgi:NADH-quinone oxidoreductase subunit G